jgi:hypothetical protein
MRWVATLLALVLVLATVGLGFLPHEVLRPLVLTIAALAGAILAAAAATLRRLLDTKALLALQPRSTSASDRPSTSPAASRTLYLPPVFNVLLRHRSPAASASSCRGGGWFRPRWAGARPSPTTRSPCAARSTAYADPTVAHHGLQITMMLLTAHFVSRLATSR